MQKGQSHLYLNVPTSPKMPLQHKKRNNKKIKANVGTMKIVVPVTLQYLQCIIIQYITTYAYTKIRMVSKNNNEIVMWLFTLCYKLF